MTDFLKSVLNAQPSALLIIAGLVFIGAAILGRFKSYFDLGNSGRIAAGISGIIFLLLGLSMSPGKGSTSSSTPPVVGTWKGVVLFPNESPLHIILKVQGANDNLYATVDSPDQNATSLTVDSITVKNRTVHFTMIAIGVDFKGDLLETGNAITGTFAQHGVTAYLVLTRD